MRYKFKNSKEGQKSWSVVTFSGAVISTLDLKRSIVAQKKLDKSGGHFDLALSNAQTGEGDECSVGWLPKRDECVEYKDDNFFIPKNTSVIVRRVPSTVQRNLLSRLSTLYRVFVCFCLLGKPFGVCERPPQLPGHPNYDYSSRQTPNQVTEAASCCQPGRIFVVDAGTRR